MLECNLHKQQRPRSNRRNEKIQISGKNKNERATSEVGLLVHHRYENNVQESKYISDRILQVTPDVTKPQKKKKKFYELLQAHLDNIPRQNETVILGNFNARIGNKVINGIRNRFNEDTLNYNGDMLINFCAMNELQINNTLYPYKPQHKFTFENTRGQKSITDYVIRNKNIHPTKILDVRVLSSANTGSNHNLVLMKQLETIRVKNSRTQNCRNRQRRDAMAKDTNKHHGSC
ncbi:craniofacial development protein 2-like [Polistes fuscatus]|uniref:craniofacial development protein 2-like n=1 Tax=Polistes fuscatus TaxID=30207 RepID=UPI001CA94F37|nr:craniofacial development protein 2-like [Polistes fuscatus]